MIYGKTKYFITISCAIFTDVFSDIFLYRSKMKQTDRKKY